MSFLMYQRSDPRNKDWPPLITQQIRLRNIIQIIGVNIETAGLSGSPRPKSPGRTSPVNNEAEEEEIYFTLHSRPMSVPFYTSDKLKMEKLIDRTKSRILPWKEIEPKEISEAVRLSTSGFTICVWASLHGHQNTIISWGVFFQGLYYIGTKHHWNSKDLKKNTLVFRTPFGYFTSLESLIKPPMNAQRFVSLSVPKTSFKPSYTVKHLAALHRTQRAILEEVELGRQLKSNITLYGYSPEITNGSSSSTPAITFRASQLVNEKILARIHQGKRKLVLKEELENLRQKINILRDEKEKALTRVSKFKADKMSNEVNNNSLDLLSRMQSLGREKSRLFQMKVLVQERKRLLTDLSSKLFVRRKQLISELLLIYPVSLVEGSKRYSINEVQLPNAEDYGSEGGGQISVSLGYTAHMVAMLSFFLGVPLRYPISHFGSRSRITDHITMQIPDKEREFPLYFRSKEDVYSKYGVYLLNKNVAQLRWYCGLSTADLRATLPNLLNLLQTRLTIPGWPPSPGETLEIAQELTEEVDEQLCRSEISVSLDKGLDQIGHPDKGIENAWLRSSFSDLECAGGNVVPSGEVRHSRAQDRFLSGWRKKTYESEDIDSNWLINSLNLDFDGGRRLSSSSNSSLSGVNRLLQPIIFLNDDGLGFPQSRRHGRVERSHNDKLGLPSDKMGLSAASNSTPNENMSQVENHIKQLERKRSFCKEHHSQWHDSRGRRHSSGPTVHAVERLPLESSTDRDDDRVADFVRRMSLGEMERNRNKSPEALEQASHDKVKEEDESEEDISSLRVENDNDNNTEVSERELLFSKPESPAHLSTKYFDHSSGDERGDTPSPSFIRKPSHQQEDTPLSTITAINSSIEQLTQNILNFNSGSSPAEEPLLLNGNEPPEIPAPTADSNLATPTQTEKDVPSSLATTTTITTNPESSLSLSQANICDNDNDIISTTSTSHSQDSDPDDKDLWFRTEALVSNSKSFNMVKRRMSKGN